MYNITFYKEQTNITSTIDSSLCLTFNTFLGFLWSRFMRHLCTRAGGIFDITTFGFTRNFHHTFPSSTFCCTLLLMFLCQKFHAWIFPKVLRCWPKVPGVERHWTPLTHEDDETRWAFWGMVEQLWSWHLQKGIWRHAEAAFGHWSGSDF